MSKGVSFVLIFFILFACAPEKSPEEQAIKRLEKELELQPTPERANALIDEIINFVAEDGRDPVLIHSYLQKGLATAKENNLSHRMPGFLVPLLKDSDDPAERMTYLLDLGDVMYDGGRRHASNVIYSEVLESFPEDEQVIERSSRIDSLARYTDDYVTYLFQGILENPDEYGVNKEASIKFIDAAEALAMSSPDKPIVAQHLYKAAEVARSRRDLGKAMSLYDWVLDSYPDYENAPTVLFIKGFILEQDFKEVDQARLIYQDFLAKYPDHQMASSAQFLLENLGKSEEEILDVIEERRRQNEGESN